jgi:hypothetical protein
MSNISIRRGEGGQRDSNLELYRIIVMFLIVSHHFVVNSGVLEKMYENPLSVNSIFLFLFGAWGKTGINCFMMITGYFMCKSKITLEKYVKLLCEVIFYNVVIAFIFAITGYGTWSEIFKAFFVVRRVNNGDFTTCFLIFYLLIPFWNILMKSISKKQHQYLLAILGFLYVFLGTMPAFGVVFNYVSWFGFLYIVAAYIRFYPCKKKNWGLYTGVFIFAGVLSIIGCLILGSRLDKQIAYRFVSDSNTFIAFAISVCSFMLFKRWNIGYSKLINIIGGSTFGVLCIHANSDSMRNWLWKVIFDVEGHYTLPSMRLIAYSIVCTVLIFACCTLLDIIRKRYIESFLMALLTRNAVFKRMQEKFEIINERSSNSK